MRTILTTHHLNDENRPPTAEASRKGTAIPPPSRDPFGKSDKWVPSGAKASDVSALARFAALVGIEYSLAHPESHRRDFDQLVGLDEVQRLFEAEFDRGREPHGDIRRRRAGVALLLFFGDVERHVFRARVHAHDHALIDLRLRLDESLRPLLRRGPRK